MGRMERKTNAILVIFNMIVPIFIYRDRKSEKEIHEEMERDRRMRDAIREDEERERRRKELE